MKMRWFAVVVAALGAAVWAKEDPRKPHVGSTAQPMPAVESEKHFKVPPGFEVRLFAAEPEVINPVAMSFDQKGRLWVVELYEYPDGAKPGTRGRDRVKVLEDTDGDGRADKVTLFCDGLSLATAVLPGNGGVYVGQAPDLYFYPIASDGPDGPRPGKRQTLLTGFGMQDRHELLNSFAWGPDGWLWFTQGVFTHSLVKDPSNPNDPGLKLDAGVYRFNPRLRKIERFADGISNQWGVDWDREGNAFVSACVVDHIWHTAPGGVYIRQGGTPNVPYTYELLRPINKDHHRHYMAAYGGINIYQGSLFPGELVGTIFMGNIHGNCLDHDRLSPDGASFSASDMRKADDAGEWLEAQDDWFRPVSEQTGPDGALWVMDWYDKYPCYQNAHAPDLDRQRGRIWRVVYVGDEKGKPIPTRPPGMDLGKMNGDQLVSLLSHPNIWQRRMAQRMLIEANNQPVAAIKELLLDGKSFEARMAALWTLGSMGELDDALLDRLAEDTERAVRMWAARFTGEKSAATAEAIARLQKLASDPQPQVRAEVAAAVRKLSIAAPMPIVSTLLKQPGTEKDPILPFLIWMAAEQQVGNEPGPILGALRGELNLPTAPDFVKRVFHRIADTKDPKMLDQAVAFLRSLEPSHTAVAAAAMDGLLDSRQAVAPTMAFDDVIAKFQGDDKDLASRAARLANLWGNTAAANALLKTIDDPKAPEEDRARGVRIAREVKGEQARKALLAALQMNGADALKLEIIQALGEVGGGEDVANAILAQWKSLSPDTRRQAAQVMAARLPWARLLLQRIGTKEIAATDIPLTAHRVMARQKDEEFTALMNSTIGPFRESTAEKAALIAQKKLAVLNGPVDLQAGHAVMARTCLVCHQFYGEGANPSVGPDLTGVGRSSVDALLANVIDPNQIIGKGYENTIVTRKDGELLTGRLVEENDDRVRLLAQGPVEHSIERRQIKSMRTENISVMPEGLEQMPEADLRNLVWYVFSPPQDDAQRKVKVERESGKLIVKARLPGSPRLSEIFTCSLDGGSLPLLGQIREPAGRPLDATVGAQLSGTSAAQGHTVQLIDLQETNDRVSWRTLVDAGSQLEQEQEVTVYAMGSTDSYRVDLAWTLRSRSSLDLKAESGQGIIVRLSGSKAARIGDAIDLQGQAGSIALIPGASQAGRFVAEGGDWVCFAPADRVHLGPNREKTWHIRLLVHRGQLDAGLLKKEQLDLNALEGK